MDSITIGRVRVRRAVLGHWVSAAAMLATGSCDQPTRGTPAGARAQAQLRTECAYAQELETQLDQGTSEAMLQKVLYNERPDAKFWALAGTQIRDVCSRPAGTSTQRTYAYIQLARDYRKSFVLDTLGGGEWVKPMLDSVKVTGLKSEVCSGGDLNLITYFVEKNGRRRYFNGFALLTHGAERIWRELDRGAAFFPGDFPSPTIRIIAFTGSSSWQSGGKYILFSKDLPQPWQCPVVIELPA